jgi:hypothetical protein
VGEGLARGNLADAQRLGSRRGRLNIMNAHSSPIGRSLTATVRPRSCGTRYRILMPRGSWPRRSSWGWRWRFC